MEKRSTSGALATDSGKKKSKGKVQHSTLVAAAATGAVRKAKSKSKEDKRKECKEVGLNFGHAY